MFTLGIDYGTNSVRALVVRSADGKEFGSCVVNYPSGHQGVLLDPRDHNVARQHPGDYLVGLERSVKGALAQAKSGLEGAIDETARRSTNVYRAASCDPGLLQIGFQRTFCDAPSQDFGQSFTHAVV